jgi:multimeric flavodoxin WrbA
MKIVSLVGTPHGLAGATGRLTDVVLEGAAEEGAEAESIALKGANVLPCRGCDVCHVKGGCSQIEKDEFGAIYEKIQAADGLILASPNYIFSVSAQMKAFMDRCCGVIHCLGFDGKYGASVVTSGGGDEEPIAEYMNHFLLTTGAVPVGSVWATMGLIEGDQFPEDIREQALELGRRLATYWRKGVLPEGFAERREQFYERMKTLMLWKKDEWPYEYNHWVRHHGL